MFPDFLPYLGRAVLGSILFASAGTALVALAYRVRYWGILRETARGRSARVRALTERRRRRIDELSDIDIELRKIISSSHTFDCAVGVGDVCNCGIREAKKTVRLTDSVS